MTDDESDIENMDIVADYEDNPDSSGVGYMSPPLSRLTSESDLNYSIYRLTVALCDPLQQPPDNDKQVLSLDFLADILIPLSYHEVSQKPHFLFETSSVHLIKFTLSTIYFRLYCALQETLNTDDELKLRHVDNSPDHWFENLHYWVPSKEVQSRPRQFKVYYSMSCLLLVAIYKLFAPESPKEPYNLTKNPYLFHLVRSWKCHTNVILLALEIDRRIELQNEEEDSDENQTPEIIYNVLEGSSAVRSVLAWILNQNPSVDIPDTNSDLETIEDPDVDWSYDIKELPLLEFVLPLSRRRANCGALRVDMRLIVIALIIIRSGSHVVSTSNQSSKPPVSYSYRKQAQQDAISSVGDLLVDLEYDDRFDEDIRYVFEFELDGFQDEDEKQGIDDSQLEPVAIGDNMEYTPAFLEVIKSFESATEEDKRKYIFDDVTELGYYLKFVILKTSSSSKAQDSPWDQVLLNSIAYAKHAASETHFYLYPGIVLGFLKMPASIEDIEECRKKNLFLLPISPITNFELFLKNNTQLARSVLDELMMFPYTRSKTLNLLSKEQNLNPLMIDYVYELVSGLRGRQEHSAYTFSRLGGKVILDEREIQLFLHNFLTRCSEYFAAVDGFEDLDGNRVILPESVAKKTMSLLCLMINRLVAQGIIALGSDGPFTFNTELRGLLIGWIGRVKEARTLYFEISSALYDDARDGIREQANGFEDETREKVEEPPTKARNYGISESTMAKIESWESSAETVAIVNTSKAIRDEFDNYVGRLKEYIASIVWVSEVRSSIPADIVAGDLRFYLDNFNVLCKVDYFAGAMFEVFESCVSSEPRLGESEFSEAFINGETEFKDGKKKKKKKKSKKKK
ncbi:hypothetical protein PGUG_00529 [Meyerozyma guilliermondii ATCC 6260]|uniref:Uncharacterized protein n=1 Tax=Meyerozyma guilliermondii (strain ATCC 6260 / CBS 566 / DSM 6381 / JCM 1539 / NBRC 10279 / NRRL Y-324) TaxID=294746 RepID=A5DB74_PICGU|nr:uncharacterized protein PGUG_00529 [Meyerozyma guilliermondii ATCC 6260]EDK36431.2 hypothetical protein PGUG_00529 [Meyerozyma guilliermondii ATCC 6260]